jgi:hypothetical protein
MKEVSDKDKLFYFEKNFFTLDGLWMIETEKEIGWDRALKIDLTVWIRLLKIIFRRVMKYLGIENNSLKDLIEILTFRWSIEGWKYKISEEDQNEVIIEIKECPYEQIMSRNPKRREKIPLICKNMCVPFYKEIIQDFNSDILLEREKYQGLGDHICDFRFRIK